MTSQKDDDNVHTVVERQARAAFDASVANLDAATLLRLNQSRQSALAAANDRAQPLQRWIPWLMPAGAVAAAALIAVLVLRTTPDRSADVPITQTAVAESSRDPLLLLAAGDDLELATEADLDFYAWVELETAAADGVT